jgi:putative component of toxin-antitoxin plasmid stabilization module
MDGHQPMDVREYLTTDGKNLYREWLDTLDVTPRARIQARVLRFSTGNLSATTRA